MECKICTFNIRKNKDEGLQSFENRLPLIENFMASEKPDIIGFQEVMPEPYSTLIKIMPDHDFIGVGRLADGSEEAVPLAWRRDVLKKVDGGTFWLSQTPSVPGSRAFDTYWPRICTWVELESVADSVKRKLLVMNLHLDNLSLPAQELGLNMAKEKALEAYRNGRQVVIMGDFNVEPDGAAVRSFEEDVSGFLKDTTVELTKTYHGWGTESEKIDYIYVSRDMEIKKPAYTCESISGEGTYISDHWPVVVSISNSSVALQP